MTLRDVPPKLRRQNGFTLIEVMVALAILALVAVVASQASGTYLRSVTNLKTRTLAHFVAQNSAAKLQIDPQWVQTSSQSQVTEQGQAWQVTITPTSNIEGIGSGVSSPYATLQKYVKPISIQVAPIDGQTGTVKNQITELTLLISNPQAIGLQDTGLDQANANASSLISLGFNRDAD